MNSYICGLACIVFVSISTAVAEQSSLTLHTDEMYYYGDHLVLTILVQEVTERSATLYIIDEYGKSSSPILLEIIQKNTTSVSPFPFDSQIHPTGRYTIKVIYADQEASTEFLLADSGRLIIPTWIKDVGRIWVGGLLPDQGFADAIKHLIRNGMITGSEIESTDTVIPPWLRISTDWWVRGLISDDEFAKSLQFLIQNGIVILK